MKVGLIMKALTRSEFSQRRINERCNLAAKTAFNELLNSCGYDLRKAKFKKLRSCNAKVYETKNWYILQSYETPVAYIWKHGFEIYDNLRIEYGYTATSAQHIAKFIHDYTPDPLDSPRFTAR